MVQWFVAVNGQQQGPFAKNQLLNGIASGMYTQDTLVWTEGYAAWRPISQAMELQQQVPPSSIPSIPAAHEIDYEIKGDEMQYVVIELDVQESAVAEAGAMMFMTQNIAMETIFGDGSQQSQQGDFMSRMLGAGSRLITGEGLFITAFTHNGKTGKEKVAFAAPYPGKIIPLDLKKYDGQIICQKDAFLCAAKGVSIGIAFQKKVMTALFGGEGFIMQKLEGDGLCFVHAGGSILEYELQAGEHLRVDTGCLVALTATVIYDVVPVGGIKSAVFGGEGIFLASLQGPGHVWLQSLPFSRLAGRVHRAAPQTGSERRGEGSLLGELGTLFER